MAVNHPGIAMSLDELIRIVRREAVATIQNSSMGGAGLRVYGGGSITIQNGGLYVTGTASVSGLLSVAGRLLGTGELVWSGPWELAGNGLITGATTVHGPFTTVGQVTVQGPSSFTGPMGVVGTLNVTGAAAFGNSVDVLSRLTLGPSGYIEAGSVRIDRLGTYGGRIASSGSVLALDASGSVVVNAPYLVAAAGSFTDLSAIGTISANIKNFLIPHPTKPDHMLRHGATESPVSGVEYWGEETLPDSGELTVALPDYFEALTKPEGRAVLVTARGFIADWGDIVDGAFTVTGKPGGRFSWLVKAERAGADFVLEEPVFGPLREGAA